MRCARERGGLCSLSASDRGAVSPVTFESVKTQRGLISFYYPVHSPTRERAGCHYCGRGQSDLLLRDALRSLSQKILRAHKRYMLDGVCGVCMYVGMGVMAVVEALYSRSSRQAKGASRAACLRIRTR